MGPWVWMRPDFGSPLLCSAFHAVSPFCVLVFVWCCVVGVAYMMTPYDAKGYESGSNVPLIRSVFDTTAKQRDRRVRQEQGPRVPESPVTEYRSPLGLRGES